MILFGKLGGAILGYKIATWFHGDVPAFCIGGILMGHVADAVVQTKIEKWKATRYWQKVAQAESNRLFFQSLFSMLGKLVVVDGPVNDEENASFEKIVNEVLRLPRKAKKEALQIFRFGQVSQTSFQYEAARYYEVFKEKPDSLENTLAILFVLATSDGKLKVSEENLIRSAAMVFNFPEASYLNIRRKFTGAEPRQSEYGENGKQSQGRSSGSKSQEGKANGAQAFGSSFNSYEILGCSPSDPESVIKQKYRKLVSDYHPDKIVSKDLPEDFLKFANEKFKTIQQAYEQIKAERGFH